MEIMLIVLIAYVFLDDILEFLVRRWEAAERRLDEEKKDNGM